MKSCENVIVTLRFLPEGKCLDMELPAFLPAFELSGKILETLRVMNPAGFGSVTELRLGYKGTTLNDSDTLAAVGCWDGGILEATLHKGG